MSAALLGALGLVVLGQMLVARGAAFQRPGLLVVAIGLALFVLAQVILRRRAVPRLLQALAAGLRLAAHQPILLAAAFAAAYAARHLAGTAALPPNPAMPYLVWGAAILLAIAGSYRPAAAAAGSGQAERWQRWEVAALAVVFAAALAIRLVGNGQAPASLTGDEGSAGLMAAEWAEGRFANPFVLGWYSFPSLFFSLPGAAISLIGRDYSALRAPSALAGALTVVGLYWMARPMFGRAAALLSAIFLASLNLHLHFSRIGLNNIWDGLFAVLAVGAFWRGWHTGRRGWFVATGLVMGLSQYFYTSALLLPLILLAWVGLHFALNTAAARQRLPDLLMAVLVAMVVYLPLGLFYVSNPDEFLGPINRVGLLSSGWFEQEQRETGQSFLAILLGNYRDAALGFTAIPLRAWYGAGAPLLLPLPAGLFLLGLSLILVDLRSARGWLVLLWLAGITSIGALTESPPAGQRYVMAAPVAALLVGWAAASLSAHLGEAWPRAGRSFAALALGLVLVCAAQDARFYFTQYIPAAGQGDPNTQVASALGLHLKGYPDGWRAYFFGGPRMSYQGFSTLGFLAPQVEAESVADGLTAPPDWPLGEAGTAFIFLPELQAEASFVVERYQGGEARWFYNRQGEQLFWLYEVGPEG